MGRSAHSVRRPRLLDAGPFESESASPADAYLVDTWTTEDGLPQMRFALEHRDVLA